MKKNIFVSGCFDLLHSGLIAFIEEDNKRGNVFLGICSDRNIMYPKKRHPINSEEIRFFVIKSLRVVKSAWINSGIQQ